MSSADVSTGAYSSDDEYKRTTWVSRPIERRHSSAVDRQPSFPPIDARHLKFPNAHARSPLPAEGQGYPHKLAHRKIAHPKVDSHPCEPGEIRGRGELSSGKYPDGFRNQDYERSHRRYRERDTMRRYEDDFEPRHRYSSRERHYRGRERIRRRVDVKCCSAARRKKQEHRQVHSRRRYQSDIDCSANCGCATSTRRHSSSHHCHCQQSHCAHASACGGPPQAVSVMMPSQHQQHQHQLQHQQSVLVSPVYSVLNMGYGFGSQMHSGIIPGQMPMGNQEQMQENQMRSDGSTNPPAQHMNGSQQQFGVPRQQAGRGDSDNE
jgi:hypothetical protein